MPSKSDVEISRRDFLSLTAASMAFAGLTGCSSAPPEKIVPYVRAPENLLPGRPQFYATSLQGPGYGLGLIVESHEARPIKIEGNPDHPASLGATDVFAQASLLTLYDPDRAQTVTQAGNINTWDSFITQLQLRMTQYQGSGSLRILTETITSPSLADMLQQLLRTYPAARWHHYEPVNRDNARAGARLAFGRYVDTQYKFEDADLIISLDSDFLTWQPGNLRYAREFSRRRKIQPGESRMNRLYVVESSMTITGAMADHRFAMRSSDIRKIARAIAQGIETSANQQTDPPWLGILIEELQRTRGRGVVIAGEDQPPEVHAMVHLINGRLGNVDQTVFYTEPIEANAGEQTQSLRELVEDMAAGRVDTLVILGGNPVYTSPADFDFAQHLSRIPLTVHQSLYFDETAERCHWHVPETHYLESWGDVRAYDGSVSIIQPLILPLYQSKTSYEVVSAILGDPSRSNYDLVRGYWQRQFRAEDFDSFWIRVVRQGVVPGSQAKPLSVRVRTDIPPEPAEPDTTGKIELLFKPDPTIFDGRWANNSWLQELPKPITKLTWDNAALMSAGTAGTLGLRNEDVVELKAGDRTVRAPVWIVAGQPDRSVTVHLGYGRHRCGRVGNNKGFNAYLIRTSGAMSILESVEARRTGERYKLVSTQEHHQMENRHPVRHATAEEYKSKPNFAPAEAQAPDNAETLYPEFQNIDYAWGMSVDLSACIGCNACVVACQAENNIPVVGKNEVANSREMHWLRIDTYFEGSGESPAVYFEPMLCQHCENAPCELVCPVEATSHSAEGINEMTYNRCVGTRYCSNNCPYKVRRFNFYQYTEWNIPQFKLLYNPDVTVRSRGVMEKCTYCIQRINRARIEAKKEDRKIRDGEVITACQAVCPAEAIIFGNQKDPESLVSKSKAEPRSYSVLAELNTRPRTTYLAKLTNPNPDLGALAKPGVR